MKSSVKINNRIDMSGKSVSFSTKEKANRIPVKSLDRQKFNMNKMAKNALGSIPSCVLVTGSSEQRAEMEILKMVQGSIPVVIGSLTKTELKKSGEKTMGIKDINYVMYHDTTGVRTAAKAASGNKNTVLSNINKSERNGWVKTEIGWMYNENGKSVTGWKLIDGKWYYFESTGVMQTGWKQISGKWYYLHTDGAMRTDWKQIGGKWYYFHTDGAMRTGWKQIDGKWYYFHTDGAMRTGWKQIGDKWYYLYEDGHMAKSEKIQGKDGKVYDIDENGVCILSSSRSIDEKIENFMDGTAEIGNWYTKNITTYLGGEIVNGDRTRRVKKCELINNIDIGDDCSGFVSACLCKYGILTNTWYGSFAYNKDNADRNDKLISALEQAGFVWHKKDDKYIPKRGDILVQHEHYGKENVKHVEIVDSYDGKEAQVWSWGKVYKSLPALRTKSELYGRTSGYWRIEK